MSSQRIPEAIQEAQPSGTEPRAQACSGARQLVRPDPGERIAIEALCQPNLARHNYPSA